jgi:cob(I)alamin adenosyltransferase
MADRELRSGKWDVLILDEINNAIALGLVDVSDVLTLANAVPEGMDLVLTGRDAGPELIERADIVSEIREVKHPYTEGRKGKKGVEW